MSRSIIYFFFPSHKHPTSVHRQRRDESGIHLEKWNGKEWEHNPRLIAAWGIGGDHDYYETTEEEALAFVKAHTTR